MRFKELRDVDGTSLAQGLHPGIAVVAANSAARTAAISAVYSTGGGKILNASDVEHQLQRAKAAAAEQHAASVDLKQAGVDEAEQSLNAAAQASLKAAHDASVASEDQARFDDLATRLAAAEETYEAAVRADAEAARSLAASLSELDRVLGQRHSASTSLEQARASSDGRVVPEAVIEQAMNLQAALAAAESEGHEAVQQADEISRAARTATREAMADLEIAHGNLRSGMALLRSDAPDWGAGLPLPGLVTNYRDQLAAVMSASQAADSQAMSAERSAAAHLEQQRCDLDALIAAGPPALDPQETVENWAKSEYFAHDDAVLADDAFDSFGPEGVTALITALSARGSQVIYLTADPDVLGWAIGLPHETGGATTIPDSHVRTPVLIDALGTS